MARPRYKHNNPEHTYLGIKKEFDLYFNDGKIITRWGNFVNDYNTHDPISDPHINTVVGEATVRAVARGLIKPPPNPKEIETIIDNLDAYFWDKQLTDNFVYTISESYVMYILLANNLEEMLEKGWTEEDIKQLGVNRRFHNIVENCLTNNEALSETINEAIGFGVKYALTQMSPSSDKGDNE